MNEKTIGKRKLSIRASLCMSLVSLVLCCAMLFATTYAWFTISIEMPESTIQAGFLSFEVLKYENNVGTPVNANDTTTDSTATLFPQVENWSPTTAPQSVTLSVKNTGSLPMKYAMYLRIKSSLSGNDVLNTPNETYIDKLEYALWVTVSTEGTGTGNSENGETTYTGPFGNNTSVITTVIPDNLKGTQNIGTTGNTPLVSNTPLSTAVLNPIAWGEMPAAVMTDTTTTPNCPETNKITITINMNPDAADTFQHGKIIFDVVVVATQRESENVPLVISTQGGLTAAANGKTAVYLYSQRDADNVTVENANEYTLNSIGSLKKIMGQSVGTDSKPEISLKLGGNPINGVVFTSLNTEFTAATTVQNCTFVNGRATGGVTIKRSGSGTITFDNCSFDAQVKFNGTGNIKFNNCRIAGELLTKDNIATKLGNSYGASNIA